MVWLIVLLLQLIICYAVVNNSRFRQSPILAALSQQQIIHSNFQDNIITLSYIWILVLFLQGTILEVFSVLKQSGVSNTQLYNCIKTWFKRSPHGHLNWSVSMATELHKFQRLVSVCQLGLRFVAKQCLNQTESKLISQLKWKDTNRCHFETEN